MRGRNLALIVGLTFGVAAMKGLQGCGGSNHGPSATFIGNVSAVREARLELEKSPRARLPRLDALWPAKAFAQSTVRHVLVCASNGRDPTVCTGVNNDTGEFQLSLDLANDDFKGGFFGFIDDSNQNGKGDNGEGFAFLTNDYKPVCDGTVVVLTDVSIDFPTHAATAPAVDKEPDTCPPRTPTVTRTPSRTPTRAPTGTPTVSGTATVTPTRTLTPMPTVAGTATVTPTSAPTVAGTPTMTRTPSPGGTPALTPTRTPTASYGASLNGSPSMSLAFFSSLAIAGLLLPVRRRSK